jgi:hypothetical protein
MLGSALAWLRLSCILPGLLRTASFRINPIFVSSLFSFFLGGGGSCEPNFFVHISASWVEISLYTEFPLPRLPGSRTVIFRPNPMGWGGLVDPIFFVHVSPCWV